MLDPIGGFHRIRDLLISQMETSQRIRNPIIAMQRKKLLLTPNQFVAEPIFEPIPRYQISNNKLEMLIDDSSTTNPVASLSRDARVTFVELALSGLFPGNRVDHLPIKRSSVFNPYLHQTQMLSRGLKSGHPSIVTSGTGSGKTESFMLPILAALSAEALQWPAPIRPLQGDDWYNLDKSEFRLQRKNEHPDRPKAVRALVLYPMNALVEDQLTRLRKTLQSEDAIAVMDDRLKGNRMYFGRYTSMSPVTGFLNHPRLSNDKDERAKRKQRLNRLKEALADMEQRHVAACEFDRQNNDEEKTCYLFPSVSGSELVSRWDMQETPPDLLVTNSSMLAVMLSREVDGSIFDKTREWLINNEEAYFYLVLDELHLIRGSSGTEIAGLVRTLINRLGLDQVEHRHKLRILASSASLPTEGHLADQSTKYLYDFFGAFGSYSKNGSPEYQYPQDWLQTIITGQQVFSTDFDRLPFSEMSFIKLAKFLSHAEEGFVAQVEHSLELDSHLLACAESVGLNINNQEIGETVRELVSSVSDAVITCAYDVNKKTIRPISADRLERKIFGENKSSQVREALRGLMIVRGLGDQLDKIYKIKPLEGLPSIRVHTFFRSVEGLFGAPILSEQGELNIEGLGSDRAHQLIECEDGANRRSFELLICEACGELFIGGQRGSELISGAFELNITGNKLEEMPEKAPVLQFENQLVSDYAVFWPTNRLDSNSSDVWNRRGLDTRNGIIFPSNKLGVGGLLFEPKDESTLQRPGGALPCACPACNTDYSGRLYKNIKPSSPIRNFRVGFSRASQLLATELFEFLHKSGNQAKSIVFSDSRQDAARAALNIESMHHRDLRRLLLINSIDKIIRNRESQPSIDDLRKQRRTLEDQGKHEDAELISDQMRILNSQPLLDRVALNEVLESKNEHNLGGFLKEFLALGVHPIDPAGIEKIKDKDWYEWFQYKADRFEWLTGSDQGGIGADARDLIRVRLLELSYDILFSKTYFSLEESGLGWVALCGKNIDQSMKLDAWLRVLADKYRVYENRYFNPETIKVFTSASEIPKKDILFRFAASINKTDPLQELEWMINQFGDLGHRGAIVDLARLYVRPSMESDPFYRCEKCGRVHLHLGAGICTRCFEELKKTPQGSVKELWANHFLAKKIKRSLDTECSGFRLHCEELTGQTNNPAQRLQAFKGIFVTHLNNLDEYADIRKRAEEVDLLSVTTTMEVGIDIGSLQAVYQANMPPQRFNYQQRVGRAGRRGQAFSMITTLCRNRSHDLHYFLNPEAITADAPPPPFLTFQHEAIHKRIINKMWLAVAFSKIRADFSNNNQIYSGDTVNNTHGDFPLASDFYAEKMNWKELLLNALISTNHLRIDFIANLLHTNNELRARLQTQTEPLMLVKDIFHLQKVGASTAKPLGQFLAEHGLLPLYGMPTNVRPFYLGVGTQSEDGFLSVSRDAETAIYEFAPNQQLVLDKKHYASLGFTTQLLPPFDNKNVRPSSENASWTTDTLWIAECPACRSYNSASEPEQTVCNNCHSVLSSDLFLLYNCPTAYISTGKPLTEKEVDDLNMQNFLRITTLEHKPTKFNLVPNSNLEIGTSAENETSVIRLNQGGLDYEGNAQGFQIHDQKYVKFEGARGRFWYTPPIKAVASNKESPTNGMCSVRLMSRKKTDGVFLLPQSVSPFLDLSNCARDDRYTGLRAGLISATQLIIQRAALELDINPEEFEMLEPRIYQGRPVLQIADVLANGAGFCRRLSDSVESKPLVQSLIESMVLWPEQDVLMRHFNEVEHMKKCQTACYYCMQRYGNRMYHGLLDWRLGVSFLRLLIDKDYLVGLDNNWSAFELKDWQHHSEMFVANLQSMRPDQFEIVHVGKLAVSALRKKNELNVVIHPFWRISSFIEQLQLEYPDMKIRAFNSFEAARRPIKLFT